LGFAICVIWWGLQGTAIRSVEVDEPAAAVSKPPRCPGTARPAVPVHNLAGQPNPSSETAASSQSSKHDERKPLLTTDLQLVGRSLQESRTHLEVPISSARYRHDEARLLGFGELGAHGGPSLPAVAIVIGVYLGDEEQREGGAGESVESSDVVYERMRGWA
jgi:hypothetical protein